MLFKRASNAHVPMRPHAPIITVDLEVDDYSLFAKSQQRRMINGSCAAWGGISSTGSHCMVEVACVGVSIKYARRDDYSAIASLERQRAPLKLAFSPITVTD